MRDSILLILCLFAAAACDSGGERFAQIGMTPLPRDYTPGTMETAARPTPADSPTPPPRH